MNKMKKISIITIILYMLFITASFADTATIDVNSARLREEANTTSKVLTNIYKGEKVEILEKNGEWYKVKYGSNTGYLKNTLIKEDSTSTENTSSNENNSSVPSSENQKTDDSKVFIKSATNIRYQPNMMSNSIVQVEVGKELTKELELGNWIKVSDGAIEGWILKSKTQTDSVQEDTSDSENTNTVNSNDTNTTNTVNNTNTTNTTNTVTNTTNTTNTVANTTTNNTVENEVKETQTSSENKKGIVNVETAKVRESASTTAKIVGFLDYNDEITILAEEGEFYKFTEKSVSGYVHKSLITPVEESISSRGTTEERIQENVVENNSNSQQSSDNLSDTNTTSKGAEVAELAKKYEGYKYVVGGKNPESGFDCSGFTRYIFLQFGYSLGSTAAEQNNIGVEVSRDALKPGDLILFYDEGKTKIGHTGIYLSNGDFIHSANPERGVVIDNINTNSYYNERYIVAKRIVE